jgi:hypothetical protein
VGPPPTAEQLAKLRKAAKRGRYRSNLRLALALYATGLGPREVLAECFGAALPDEFFALAGSVPLVGHRPEDFDHQPWKLAVTPGPGRRVRSQQGTSGEFAEERIRDRDRDLLPLLRLDDRRTEYGGLTLCYRLTELAAGRPVVFGIDAGDPGEEVERCGESLLAVLLAYHSSIVDRLEALQERAPELVTPQRLTDHRAALNQIEALRGPDDDRAATTEPPTVATLRGRASRGDYRSMARLARGLYATGLGRREVLAECFGAAFPDEFFVIVDANPHDATLGDPTNLPWELAVSLERGGPLIRPRPMMWPAERRIFGWDPDLVPLLALHGDNRIYPGAKEPPPRVRHGDLLHCYRLSELAAGRSTVFGVPWRRRGEDGDLSVKPCGPSLLTVLHEDAIDRHRLDEWRYMQPWNWGAGSIDDTNVESSREYVSEIEELQRRLGSPT